MTDGHLGVEGVVELSVDEVRYLLHRAARDRLGMSGAAFLDAWDAGRLDHLDHCDVQEVAMLIPFARDEPSRLPMEGDGAIRAFPDSFDERQRPKCGVWDPLLGPCICGDPAGHSSGPRFPEGENPDA